MGRIKRILLVVLLVFSTSAYGQNNLPKIKQLIGDKKIEAAQLLWNSDVARFEESQQFDSLPQYIQALGSIQLTLNRGGEGKQKVLGFAEKIRANTKNVSTEAYTYVHLAKYYEWISEWENSYYTYQTAFQQVQRFEIPDYDWQCGLQSNLSIIASRINRIQDSNKHLDSAVFIMNRYGSIKPATKFQIYNAMGARFYFASTFDSSLYYFNKAYETCETLEKSTRNQLYRPAMILNNMAGIYPEVGKISRAIETQKQAINLTNQYVNEMSNSEYKHSAQEFLCQQIDNLGGLNKRIGNFKEAERLLLKAYQLKQKSDAPSKLETAISEILLGQVYYDQNEYLTSEKFLKEGLGKLTENDASFSMWKATAYHYLALNAETRGDILSADSLYQQAHGFYKSTFGESYDESYLNFTKDLSRFYANNNRLPEAISIAEKAYRYVLINLDKQNLSAIRHSFNLASIYLLGKSYRKAIEYADRGIMLAEELRERSPNMLDSVMAISELPIGKLIKVQATYKQLKVKDEETIRALIATLKQALELIESQKSITSGKEESQLIVTNHKSVYDFLKVLYLDLYKLSGKSEIIAKVLAHQEAAIYSKIRSKIHSQDLTVLKGVPDTLIAYEKKLEHSIEKIIYSDPKETSDSYLSLKEKQAKLKKDILINYPDYYRLRYGEPNDSLGSIQGRLMPETTVIRYFYSDKNSLGAIVFDREESHLKYLGNPPDESKIYRLLDPAISKEDLSETLYDLYQKLWLPLQPLVRHKRVVIVPDGPLFNLSFELLTPQKIRDYDQLAEAALLSEYLISYRYSAFSLGKQHSSKIQPEKGIVAFIPGFTNRMKEEYLQEVQDSLYLDQKYMTLLPQPFSLEQGRKIASLFHSSVYFEEDGTVENFKRRAGNHEIIHLGTHAEANNVSAEFSKLIFAKDPNNHLESNILYLSDIYGCNLNSALTVITACETGVHSYLAGEGMISLGHAFQYAGSNSILTSLSKIDEQTSNIIIGYFYDYLARGYAKDEALQQAKLDYLRAHPGRLQQPHYWASLIIMGEIDAVSLKKNNFAKRSISFFLLFVLAGTLYFAFKARRRKFW